MEKARNRLLARLFDPEELALCGRRPASLAAFYAAKEAFAKALTCGLMCENGLALHDVVIRKTPQGAPYYVWGSAVDNLAARLSFPELGEEAQVGYRLKSASLSLSHEGGLALAFAVLSLEARPISPSVATASGGLLDG